MNRFVLGAVLVASAALAVSIGGEDRAQWFAASSPMLVAPAPESAQSDAATGAQGADGPDKGVAVVAAPAPADGAARVVDDAVKGAAGVADGVLGAVGDAVQDAAGAATDSAPAGITPGTATDPAKQPSAAQSWRAADLSPDQIRVRIEGADISEALRESLLAATEQAGGDATTLQTVLDQLRIATGN